MNTRMTETITLGALALGIVLGWWPARAQDAKAPYPGMAPLDQYLMADRNAEIALARSAAPAAISGDAEIQVLGRHGYETAIKGKNGFVCVVERSWMSPFDTLSFGTPSCEAHSASIQRQRDPSCRSRSKGHSWYWPDFPKHNSWTT